MYKLTGEFRLAGLQKRWNMRPIIGITMGDPASIGPEITIKALSEQSVYEKTRPIVIGDISVMQKALDTLNKVYPAGAGGVKAFDLKLHRVDTVEEASFDFGTIDVMLFHYLLMQQLLMHLTRLQLILRGTTTPDIPKSMQSIPIQNTTL